MNRCLSSIYSNSYRLRILQFSTSCLPVRCWLKFESTRVLAKFTAARFTGPEELELCYVPVSNQGEKTRSNTPKRFYHANSINANDELKSIIIG